MPGITGSPYTRGDLSTSFDATMYGSHPWAGITTKERLFYDPVLRDVYRWKAVYGQYISFQQNLANRQAKTMNITGLYDIHPNFDRIGLRDMSMPASHVDSRSQTITFERYGGKVAYMSYDDINNNSVLLQ